MSKREDAVSNQWHADQDEGAKAEQQWHKEREEILKLADDVLARKTRSYVSAAMDLAAYVKKHA